MIYLVTTNIFGVAELTQCSAQKKLYQSYSCCGGQGDTACVGKNLTHALAAVVGVRGDYAKKLDAKSTASTIKMSSLSYANSAGRVGFDFLTQYNDFNNEGHMYPVHGVGDIDRTVDLMGKFVKSASGQPFRITDLGIDIQVDDPSLVVPNNYFDFHTIPTKHLDGSTKLPDGSRVEQHIPYFNPMAEATYTNTDSTSKNDLMEIDWISGNAKFKSAANSFDYPTAQEFPTTLTSTRVTPQMKQNEYFGLTFFMDGKQARVSNGGAVSNWRYVAPGYDVDISWFVAEAMVPCSTYEGAASGCTTVTTTNGEVVSARKRTAAETANLASISYNKDRIMVTRSKPVTIRNAADKMQSFNQRYTNKQADFGDLMLKEAIDDTPATGGGLDAAAWTRVHAKYVKWVGSVMPQNEEKQIAFYEMLKVLKAELAAISKPLPGAYRYVTGEQKAALEAFKAKYLRAETYDISATALATKAVLAPSYIATPIGETGWMVVPTADELPVPAEEGEFFIGWSILTQPQNTDVAQHTNPTNGDKADVIRWAQSNGYALHQGPGMLFLTGGDFAHGGTQEPYILNHNEVPKKMASESDTQFAERTKTQLPTVHWRLDTQEVILKSLEMGAATRTNVGAGQKMLASIGTRLDLNLPSRSVNFLGKNYQSLLANPAQIQALVGTTPDPAAGEVYRVVGSDPGTFFYGVSQQTSTR